jgi:hypothetical protein
MKKQLLTAAVAATMSVSALADISITGAASMTWTQTDHDSASVANTQVYANDMDITITGTSGGTTAAVSIDISDDLVSAGDVVVTTSVAGVSLEMTEDAGALALEAVLPAIAGVTLTFNDSNANSNGSIKAAVTLMGLDVSVTSSTTATDTSIGGDLGGITVTYTNDSNDGVNKDTNSLAVSGDVGGVALAMTSHSADASAAANWNADASEQAGCTLNCESNQGTELSATMDLGGNSITVTSINADYNGAAKVDTLAIEGTRTLDSGALLTATYTNDDSANVTNTNSSLALELSVTF